MPLTREAARPAAAWLAALLAATTVVGAHHAIGSFYDAARPVKLNGVVTGIRFVPPHPFVDIDVTSRNGRTERWRLELDNHFELVAVGMTADTLRAGDRVIVTGSGSRTQERALYVRSLERPSDGFLYEQIGSSPRVRLPK